MEPHQLARQQCAVLPPTTHTTLGFELGHIDKAGSLRCRGGKGSNSIINKVLVGASQWVCGGFSHEP